MHKNRLGAFCARKDVQRTSNCITVSLIATTLAWVALTGIAQVLTWQHEAQTDSP